MAEFINTIDVIGDDVLIRSIVDGSIVEYCDNVITNIGQNAFRESKSLTTVDIPAVTNISSYAFAICSSLTTFILRNTDLIPVCGTYTLGSTPIDSGNGYIYVPRALLDSYKSATNWSTYGTKFRALEDYTVDGTVTGKLDPTKI